MNQSIQYFRVIGLLAVCIIHVNASGNFGENYKYIGFMLDELGRFAVPVFFMVSGFFFRNENFDRPIQYLKSLSIKLFPSMIIWAAIYLYLDQFESLYKGVFQGGIKSYIALPLTGGAGTHLWFLPALFVGTGLCIAGIRNIGSRRFLFITILLYLVGVGLGAYQKQFGWQIQSVFYRNGVLFAPLFLMLGYEIARNKIHIGKIPALGIALTGAFLHAYEGTLTLRYPIGHDYSFGTVLFSVGVFLLFLNISARGSWMSNLGSEVFDGYLVHLFILRVLVEFINWKGVLPSIGIALVTWALSLVFAKFARPSRHLDNLFAWLLGRLGTVKT